MKKQLMTVGATLFVLGIGVWVFVWSGFYDVAADRPHTAVMHSLLDTLRKRSIEVRTRNIKAPPLDDAVRVAEGAKHYVAMCAGCHLAPGMKDTEIRLGLLPQPPNLVEHGLHDSKEAFWIIKHGIKATGMPAWGRTHDDEEIWNLVAFVNQLPTMTPEQYRVAVGSDARDDSSMQKHEHRHGDHEH